MNKKYNILIPGIFCFLIFVFFAFITLRLNIHGDAKFHTQFAKESIKQQQLVTEQPHRIFTFEGSKRSYMPIAYPLTSESLFSIMYLFGGELFLKLYAPLFASVIFLIIYITLKDVGTIPACIISCLAIISVSERFIMTPLMEPYMLLLILSGIYCLKKYFNTRTSNWLYISSIFFGSAAAVKQQGVLFVLFIFAFLFISEIIYPLLKKGGKFLPSLIHYILFCLICIAIPTPAIYNQIQRTGTFAYSPGATQIPQSTPFYSIIQPVLTSKYKVNQDATKAIEQTVTYNRGDKSLVNKIKGFLLAPFLFYRSIHASFQTKFYLHLFALSCFIICMSLITNHNFIQKNKLLFLFLLASILAEIFNSTILKTPITQYHVLGVLLSTIIVFLSIHFVAKEFSIVGVALKGLYLSAFVIGYISYIYPLWTENGREDNYHLEGYKKIGQFVKQNTQSDAVFLAAETSFRYYAERDSVWLNESLGHKVKSITSDSDEEKITDILEDLNIDYIVINSAQTKRNGVSDYLPPSGLVSIINTSPHFSKIYDPYGDGEMVVYKIEK